MRRTLFSGVSAIALATGAPAYAQSQPAAPMTAEEAAALRAEVEALRQQVTALAARLDATAAVAATSAPAHVTAPTPVVAAATPAPAPATAAAPETSITWRATPELRTADGWSFRVRGRIHFDTGMVSAPDGIEATTRNLGFNTRFRRLRLGVEGTMPGNFGYKLEADFANANVAFGDVWVTYAPSSQWLIRAGSYEPLNGIEQISSSNHTSFLERAAFHDAFLNNRRMGFSAGWRNADDDLRVEAGLFAGHAIDSALDNGGWQFSARAVWSPAVGDGRLHLGASVQLRDFAANGGTGTSVGAASAGQLARYRARPDSQLTDLRLVDTGSFAAHGDRIIGLEAGAFFPGIYALAEAQWLTVDAYAPGGRASGLDTFAGGNSAVTPAGNPGLFGGFAEVGYFLTGETRGYGRGILQRTRVRRPLSAGGPGAFQLAARYDHLDLDDSRLTGAVTTDFTSGATSLAALNSRLGRGGVQRSWRFAFNWYPSDLIRLMVNYDHVGVDGGPLAALADPLSTQPVNERSYSADVLAARVQVEF